MTDQKMAETLLEIDGIETCYGLSQVLFGMSLEPGHHFFANADNVQGTLLLRYVLVSHMSYVNQHWNDN